VLNKKGIFQALITIFIILIIDQFIKIWIKTHFSLGESLYVSGSWFILHFTENNGMAFGMEFAGAFGKIILTIFRLIASILIAYYLYRQIVSKANGFLIITISLVLAGALGNIIDSMFYGLIFSESTPFQPAVMFPDGGGYASFMFGKVVDMFYFPIIETRWPGWMPFWAGEEFIFFQPVFNIADAAITVGVLILLVFQKRLFKKPEQAAEKAAPVDASGENPA
jgi:signal peptidase II